MPLFDSYIAVDWSASNSPKRGKDSIWIGEAGQAPFNPRTRQDATDWLTNRCLLARAQSERLLLGFDFAFGLPAGLTKAITGDAHWGSLWDWLARHVEEGPNNRNNRFQVAEALNRVIGLDEGPFWGHPHQHDYEALKPTAPKHLPPSFPYRRIVERRVPSAKSVFQLAYTGAVGSQALLGMAALQRMRSVDELGDHMAIWPFETRLSDDLSAPVTIVEIYPSAHEVKTDLHTVLDAAQVLSVAQDMATWDRSGAIIDKLSAFALSDLEREYVIREEGWIFGVA